jgi:hypothetical protein
MVMAKYRKKPVIVDAELFDGSRESIEKINDMGYLPHLCDIKIDGKIMALYINTLEDK